MKTVLQIPRILRQYCDGLAELSLRGSNVRLLLEELERQHPALYQCICNEMGAVRPHIHLFINNDFLCVRDGLDTLLQPGDVVSVFQAVSGG